MNFKKMAKYGLLTTYVGMPLLWYNLSLCDKNYVKKRFYDNGNNFAQKFKNYPMWNKYIEPLILRQCGILFIAGHSFLEGMISNNDNMEIINKDMEILDEEIKYEIKEDIDEDKIKNIEN